MRAPQVTVLAMLAFAPLAGCALGPAHPDHTPLLQPATLGLADSTTPPIAAEWWRSYGDPALDALVARALQGNPTLADAIARMRAAEAAVSVAGSPLRPHVRGSVNEERSHFSARSFYPPPYGGGTFWDGDLDVAVTWHLDFWGRQRDQLAAAEHDARARAIGVRGARLAIETAVVSAYVELDRAWRLRDLAHESVAEHEHLAAIAEQRSRAGLDAGMEMEAAHAATHDARVEEREAATRIDLAVHRLAALTGQGPAAYSSIARPSLHPGTAPPLPTVIPADLLLRRGDIGAALEHLRATGALEHAARAAAYPDINLRAFAGLTAFGLRELLSAPARTMGGGLAIGLPIYDGGKVRAELRGANAAVESAIAAYNATVLGAVRDAADQLTALDALAAEATDVQARVESLDRAARLAAQRRDAGLVNEAPAAEARLRLLAARRADVSIDTASQLARIALIAALGGSADDPSLPDPAATKGAP